MKRKRNDDLCQNQDLIPNENDDDDDDNDNDSFSVPYNAPNNLFSIESDDDDNGNNDEK